MRTLHNCSAIFTTENADFFDINPKSSARSAISAANWLCEAPTQSGGWRRCTGRYIYLAAPLEPGTLRAVVVAVHNQSGEIDGTQSAPARQIMSINSAGASTREGKTRFIVVGGSRNHRAARSEPPAKAATLPQTRAKKMMMADSGRLWIVVSSC